MIYFGKERVIFTDRSVHILNCRKCGRKFVFREAERPITKDETYVPRYCPTCVRNHKKEKEEKEAALSTEKRKKEKAAELARFKNALTYHNTVSYTDIIPDPDHTLIVIGNGFDLMHGVRSNYYDFRDSLGKSSSLRENLEIYIDAEDIWADFENNLAKINYKSMTDSYVMDMWLDEFGAYTEDSASSYYRAVDTAVLPLYTICTQLPKRFRQWVSLLRSGIEDKPLLSLIADCPVLCFNYTEFVETIYGVSPENVCYIHGCRKKKENLILGHIPSDDSCFTVGKRSPRDLGGRMPSIRMAQEHAAQMLADYDDELTKPCDKIIAANNGFFSRLKDIDNIIIIGHSLYPVDRDYFREIIRLHTDPSRINWFFGCHGLSDLMRIDDFINEFKIKEDKAAVFRTDIIKVNIHEPLPIPVKSPKIDILCRSTDHKWTVKREKGRLFIENSDGRIVLDQEFLQPIDYAFFSDDGQLLFAVKKGYPAGVFLYKLTDAAWRLLDELAPFEHQDLINPRLKKIFLDVSRLTFVYNSRLRIYDTDTGELVESKAVQYAPSLNYRGTDISSNFKLYS